MTHTHRCACGTELRCAQEPDKCAVFPNWTCPTCEQVAHDAYWSQQDSQQLAAPIKETAREPKQSER